MRIRRLARRGGREVCGRKLEEGLDRFEVECVVIE